MLIGVVYAQVSISSVVSFNPSILQLTYLYCNFLSASSN